MTTMLRVVSLVDNDNWPLTNLYALTNINLKNDL